MCPTTLSQIPFAVILKEPAPARGRIGEVGDLTFPITANSTSFASYYRSISWDRLLVTAGSPDRLVKFGPDCCAIPERLLIAHAQGRVLFITGAGVSMPSGLPDFRGLTRSVYEAIDSAVYAVLPAERGIRQEHSPA